MQVQTRGEFGGLGIEVTMEDGLVKVVSPIDDTPASKAGHHGQRHHPALDDEAVQGLTPQPGRRKDARPGQHQGQAEDHPQGGQPARGHADPRQYPGPLGQRRMSKADDIGYIRITTFNEQTTEGLKREISNLSNQIGDKLKGFVIDLRNNPGGLLEEAVTVSDAFLERGEIVSTRGRNAEETQRRSAHPGDLTKGKQLIVLINGGSASASEDRRRRAAGPQARNHGWHALLRQGIGADHHTARLRQRRAAADHRALLHAVGPVDPGQGHRPRYRGAAGCAGRAEGPHRYQGRSLAARPPEERGDEKTGSQAYVPPDAKDDKALKMADDLLHGVKASMPAHRHRRAGHQRQGRHRQAATEKAN